MVHSRDGRSKPKAWLRIGKGEYNEYERRRRRGKWNRTSMSWKATNLLGSNRNWNASSFSLIGTHGPTDLLHTLTLHILKETYDKFAGCSCNYAFKVEMSLCRRNGLNLGVRKACHQNYSDGEDVGAVLDLISIEQLQKVWLLRRCRMGQMILKVRQVKSSNMIF